jgi:Uma2 family endonuclease
MATVPATRLSVEEYLERERQAEFKSEYVAGEIFAMSGASRRHVLIATNLTAELRQALRARSCRVYSADLRVGVQPAGLYTYPDIVVTCGQETFQDEQFDTLLNPMLIIEVLSESTADYDRGRKFESYRALDSLQDYLTVAQDRVHVEHWTRQADGRWLLTEFNHPSASIWLPSIDVQLAVASIYEKVDLAASGSQRA